MISCYERKKKKKEKRSGDMARQAGKNGFNPEQHHFLT